MFASLKEDSFLLPTTDTHHIFNSNTFRVIGGRNTQMFQDGCYFPYKIATIW